MNKIIKKLKRGFTIVELVIVIAVIAILAAVLIPTLANVINSAEESADMQTVSNLNKIVAAYDTVGDIDKVDDALDAALENGYSVSALTPTSEGNVIVYDSNSNRFALITENALKTSNPDDDDIIYTDSATTQTDWTTSTTYVFVKLSDVTADSNSVYDLTNQSSNSAITGTNSYILTGTDDWAGKNVKSAYSVSLYDYTKTVTLGKVEVTNDGSTFATKASGSSAKSAVSKMTTASSKKDTININVKAASLVCNVKNYAVNNYSEISVSTTVENCTFNEYGSAKIYDTTAIGSGKVVNCNADLNYDEITVYIPENSTVETVFTSTTTVTVNYTAITTIEAKSVTIDPPETTETGVTITITIETSSGTTTATGSVESSGSVTLELGTEKYPFLIDDVSEWLEFRDSEEATGGYYWSVTNDLDFSSTTSKVDVTSFTGYIDFNGNSVSGIALENCKTLHDSVYGGLFYRIIGDSKISNLNYKISNLGKDQSVRPVLYVGNNTDQTTATLYNVSVSGNVEYTDNNASTFVYVLYGKADLTFENCTNNADITNTGRTGIFLGKVYEMDDQTDMTVSFVNCYNYGTIQATSTKEGYASMLLSNECSFTYMSPSDVTVKGCVNYGNIYGAKNTNLFCGNTSNEKVAAVVESIGSGALVNGTKGVCATMTVDSIPTSNSVFTLNTVSGAAYYKVTFSAFLTSEEDSTQHGTIILYEYTFTSDSALTAATIYSYAFKDYDSTYDLTQVEGTDLYTTTINGTTYYVVNYSNETYGHYYLNGGYVNVTFSAYNADGELLSVQAVTL